MKQLFKTFIIIVVFLAALSGVTAYAASQKLQKRSFITSTKAEVSANIIPVGTTAGGIVKEIPVHIGQVVQPDTVIAKVDDGKGSIETDTANQAGIIQSITVSKNGFTKPQSELAEIIDNQNIFVKANLVISPEDLLKLQIGMPVSISVANTTFKGSISTIFPQYDSVNGVVSVYVSIEDSPERDRLIPGMPASVSLFISNPAWETFSPFLQQLHLL
ncbi:MAG: efflux RND transporter periplasmic adaptor subunit [bacterium]